jgi:hypothetical protein
MATLTNFPARMKGANELVRMPPEVREALWKVIDYAGPDEKRGWEEKGRPDEHIWLSFRPVIEWLNAIWNAEVLEEIKQLEAAGRHLDERLHAPGVAENMSAGELDLLEHTLREISITMLRWKEIAREGLQKCKDQSAQAAEEGPTL